MNKRYKQKLKFLCAIYVKIKTLLVNLLFVKIGNSILLLCFIKIMEYLMFYM